MNITIEDLGSVSRLFFNFNFGISNPFRFELIGKGTEKEPFIIEPHPTMNDDDYKRFQITIKESKDYLNFRINSLKSLILIDCVNVSIDNSNFQHVRLRKSSNITISDSHIKKELNIRNCNNIKIESTEIKSINASLCDNVIISNSKINKILKKEANLQID